MWASRPVAQLLSLGHFLDAFMFLAPVFYDPVLVVHPVTTPSASRGFESSAMQQPSFVGRRVSRPAFIRRRLGSLVAFPRQQVRDRSACVFGPFAAESPYDFTWPNHSLQRTAGAA